MTAHYPAELAEKRINDCLAMLQEGMTLEECGQKYGITRERVRQVLLSAGVVAGDIREARKLRLQAIQPPPVCVRCGESVTEDMREEHFKAGNHRWMKPRSPEVMARDAALAADYDLGLTLREIMAKHHVNATRVYRALHWNGMGYDRKVRTMLPTRAESYARWDAIIADWQSETLTNIEIAAKHGISSSMVAMILEKRGLSLDKTTARRRLKRIYRKRRLNGHGHPHKPRRR